MSHQYSQLSANLKRKCIDCVFDHLKDDFDAYLIEKKHDRADKKYLENDHLQDMDNFLLFGETEFGEPILEAIEGNLRLNKEEESVIKEWQKEGFQSIFDILEITKDHLRLLDLVSEAELIVYTNNDEFPSEFFPAAQEKKFLLTNLLPVHGVWFLSGGQNFVGREHEETIFREFIQKQPPENCYRHNPEKLQKAFELQKEHYDCFVSTFGTDEVIVNGREVVKTEETFFRAWSEKKNLPFNPIKIDLPSEILDSDEVGVVMDEKEGTHYFEEYGKFRNIFSEDKEITEEQEEIFKGYLINDEIPAFVFRRMKERYPERFRKVIKKFIPRSMFKLDPIKDFDSLMNIYKPFWQEIFPSVHPLNQYFEKYYQQAGINNKVGRNEPCPCESGLKFKKCCGK
ncbi:MAG: SEC-C metal-binding domain-containing protein [Candidatus Uhrbacteria bacterium]